MQPSFAIGYDLVPQQHVLSVHLAFFQRRRQILTWTNNLLEKMARLSNTKVGNLQKPFGVNESVSGKQ